MQQHPLLPLGPWRKAAKVESALQDPAHEPEAAVSASVVAVAAPRVSVEDLDD